MRMNFRFAIWIVVLVMSVAAWGDDSVASNPQDVDYCQLAKDPSSFTGKRIRVRALYVYGFEVQMLKSPACCPVPEPKMGVDFDPAMDDRSEKLFHKLDKGMGFALAVFVGRFERVSNVSSELPSGDRFQFTVDRIEKVEKSVRSSEPGKNPSWVPRDCVVSTATSDSKLRARS
jgi:hypothetical protein